MSDQQELDALRSQQKAELLALRRGLQRARRDLSPQRFIRKHPLASVTAAAVAGMIVAPRPGPSKKATASGESSGLFNFIQGWAKKLFLPSNPLATPPASTPTDPGQASTATPHPAAAIAGPLTEIVTLFATRLMEGLTKGRSPGNPETVQGPQFLVADAGTIPPGTRLEFRQPAPVNS